jgi:hypothetical protein
MIIIKFSDVRARLQNNCVKDTLTNGFF